jgi:hypothetical protein
VNQDCGESARKSGRRTAAAAAAAAAAACCCSVGGGGCLGGAMLAKAACRVGHQCGGGIYNTTKQKGGQ